MNSIPHPFKRTLTIILLFGLGVLPTIAFFLWVERNMALPWIAKELEFPWYFLMGPIWLKVLWNSALIASFGLVHTLLAQEPVQNKIFPSALRRYTRSIYVMITGLHLLAVMAFWQNTGIILWKAPLAFESLNLVSISFYIFFIGLGLWSVLKVNPMQFIGLEQLYSSTKERTSGMNHLVIEGAYKWIRHPIYFFTMSAWIVTPFMSLDRAVFCFVMFVYLMIAVPIEEKKLLETYGDSYREYQKKIPRIFPKWRRN